MSPEIRGTVHTATPCPNQDTYVVVFLPGTHPIHRGDPITITTSESDPNQ